MAEFPNDEGPLTSLKDILVGRVDDLEVSSPWLPGPLRS